MSRERKPTRDGALLDAVRRAARQEQFLEVVAPEEARARFNKHLDLKPLPAERVALADVLGRVLVADIKAPIDVPPFDRSNVDGFAVRAADIAGASDANPRRLMLNEEVLACGVAPKLTVAPGTATTIATGGMLPRGADAVVMIEHTELIETNAAPRSRCVVPRPPVSSSRLPGPTSRAARRCCAAARCWARARSACLPPVGSPRSMSCGGRKWRCFRPATNWSCPAGSLSPAASMTRTPRFSPPRSAKLVASR